MLVSAKTVVKSEDGKIEPASTREVGTQSQKRALIVGYLTYRGDARVKNQVRVLTEKGYAVDLICLAEDCELGVRFSSAGKKVVVAYSPEMVTREETPDTVKSFVKQRTRWNQGFLQVYRKGDWKSLPTARQRWLARFTLATNS